MSRVRSLAAAAVMVTGVAAAGCVPGSGALPALTGVVDLDAGTSHACVVTSDGRVRCWGMNDYQQLGNVGLALAGAYSSNVAVPVDGVGGATQVAVGGDFSCALRSSGTVACWGGGRWGQLGNGVFETYSQPPVTVLGVTGATQITAGYGFACALVAGGAVKCWGSNEVGQLGDGTVTPWPPGGVSVPTTVTGITGATRIDAGGLTACALLSSGIERCWGYGARGVLGNGDDASSAVPVTVVGIDHIVDIDVGGGHNCAVTSDGTAYCWGSNDDGRLGDGTHVDHLAPVPVLGLTGVASISAGSADTCAVLAGGTAACWGLNQYGQLGNGTTTASDVPVAVNGLSGISHVSVGENASCAASLDGTAHCWGRDYLGQLGDGANVDSSLPTTVRVLGA